MKIIQYGFICKATVPNYKKDIWHNIITNQNIRPGQIINNKYFVTNNIGEYNKLYKTGDCIVVINLKDIDCCISREDLSKYGFILIDKEYCKWYKI